MSVRRLAMGGPKPRIGHRAVLDRSLSEEARANARILFQNAGVSAIATLTAQSHNPALSREQRRYVRLLILEIERLDRQHRTGRGSHYLTLWKPKFFRRIVRWVKSLVGR